MKHVAPKETQSPGATALRALRRLMRLVGSEPHPVEAKTDLLTYTCTACDEFFVLPVDAPAAHG